MIRTLLLAVLCITAVQVQAQVDNHMPELSKQDAELVGTRILTPEEVKALCALLQYSTRS